MSLNLVCLNTCGGKWADALLPWLQSTHPDDPADIYAFQEVFHTTGSSRYCQGYSLNLYHELVDCLPGYQGYFAPAQSGFVLNQPVSQDIFFGLALFIHPSLTIRSYQAPFIHLYADAMSKGDTCANAPRNMQVVELGYNGQPLTVANLHGLWWHSSKDDKAQRLKQSVRILRALTPLPERCIIVGDFNLLPNTHSLLLLERAGFTNEMKRFGITDTRGGLYPKEIRTADYILTRGIQPLRLRAQNVYVSDHCVLRSSFD